MPVVHLIAGPRGVGKSVLRQVLITPRYPQLPFMDLRSGMASPVLPARARTPLPDSPVHPAMAKQWQAALAARTSFVAETAFDRVSDLDWVTEARRHGFQVVLYALGLDEPARLHARLASAPHDPGDRPAPQQNEDEAPDADPLRKAVFLADLSFLFDAVDASHDGPRLVASVAGGRMQLHTLVRPRWVDRTLGFAER
jgi:predicted ABC-type ATPase